MTRDLNGLTYVILALYAMATFPTRDNLRRQFEEKIAGARGKL